MTEQMHITNIKRLKYLVDLCETLAQFDRVMYKIFCYHTRRSNLPSTVMLLVDMEDYALAKGKLILFNTIMKKYEKTESIYRN